MKICQNFIDVTKEYINLINRTEQVSAHKFLSKCAILLPQIYYLGQSLPDVELPEEDTSSDNSKVEQSDSIRDNISKLLGKYDNYSKTFDPIFEHKPIQTTLADDLTSIYWDLKLPFKDYNTGEDAKMKTAIWDWKFNICSHCGDHITSALYPIHKLVFYHIER